MHSYTVEPLYVKSGQEVIAADFYRPKTEHKPAVIIMAHGLAALRQFKLIQYAQRFAQAGYAVVLFDYRYWGEYGTTTGISFYSIPTRRLAHDDRAYF